MHDHELSTAHAWPFAVNPPLLCRITIDRHYPTADGRHPTYFLRLKFLDGSVCSYSQEPGGMTQDAALRLLNAWLALATRMGRRFNLDELRGEAAGKLNEAEAIKNWKDKPGPVHVHVDRHDGTSETVTLDAKGDAEERDAKGTDE